MFVHVINDSSCGDTAWTKSQEQAPRGRFREPEVYLQT